VRTRNLVVWGGLVAVVVGAVAWAALDGRGRETSASRAADLAAELRCPDCEGLSVADSSTSTARAIRRDIRNRIDRDQSDEEIRQAYVDRYGESILLKPEGSGLGVLVWGLPVAALLLGAFGLVVALRRWRSEPRLHATAADEQLVTRARHTERS
jgi:cytochrome c-type biogenesis protein CcmH